MAEEKVKYDALTKNELIEHAKKSADIENLEERMDVGHKILTGYLTSPKVQSDYMDKKNKVNIADIADELSKKFKEKGKNLTYNEQSEFFKKMSDSILPAMGFGVKEDIENNYAHMEMYLRDASDKKNDYNELVRDAIKRGDAEGAKTLMVEAIIKVRQLKDQQNFINELIPPDDRDLHYKMAEVFVKRYDKDLADAGIEKKYSIGDVADKITSHYVDRATDAIKKKQEAKLKAD